MLLDLVLVVEMMGMKFSGVMERRNYFIFSSFPGMREKMEEQLSLPADQA